MSKLDAWKICALVIVYRQTWANDHLRITTTGIQRPSFWSPNLNLYYINLPLNNNHLSTTASYLGPWGWSLYTSLTVSLFKCNPVVKLLYSKFYRSNAKIQKKDRIKRFVLTHWFGDKIKIIHFFVKVNAIQRKCEKGCTPLSAIHYHFSLQDSYP